MPRWLLFCCCCWWWACWAWWPFMPLPSPPLPAATAPASPLRSWRLSSRVSVLSVDELLLTGREGGSVIAFGAAGKHDGCIASQAQPRMGRQHPYKSPQMQWCVVQVRQHIAD